jgi:hypothetical protein
MFRKGFAPASREVVRSLPGPDAVQGGQLLDVGGQWTRSTWPGTSAEPVS